MKFGVCATACAGTLHKSIHEKHVQRGSTLEIDAETTPSLQDSDRETSTKLNITRICLDPALSTTISLQQSATGRLVLLPENVVATTAQARLLHCAVGTSSCAVRSDE